MLQVQPQMNFGQFKLSRSKGLEINNNLVRRLEGARQSLANDSYHTSDSPKNLSKAAQALLIAVEDLRLELFNYLGEETANGL